MVEKRESSFLGFTAKDTYRSFQCGESSSNSTEEQVFSPVFSLKDSFFIFYHSKDTPKRFVRAQWYDRRSSFHKMYSMLNVEAWMSLVVPSNLCLYFINPKVKVKTVLLFRLGRSTKQSPPRPNHSLQSSFQLLSILCRWHFWKHSLTNVSRPEHVKQIKTIVKQNLFSKLRCCICNHWLSTPAWI